MNLERVEAILKVLHSQGHVGEINLEAAGWSLRARRGKSAPVLMAAAAPTEQEGPAAANYSSIRAGMVGIYRASKSPIRSGDHVQSGAAVGNIDSMGILNPVVAETAGYVVTVLVEDGDPVEFGQELFVLSPEPTADVIER